MDLNQTDLESLLQISTDHDTLGFDLRAGTTWIYPTNYPIRDYQFNIVQSALYKNTLVSLPTGLGKTFIAAVVMYNFYRWYPTGKVIFMAPTKPLVRQQIDACYNIMAIPSDVTSEMTGTKISASRVNIWKEKRVFFITPHILQNDLETIPDLGPKIRCIVIDEAHKALGRQANCEVIRKLIEVNTNFRVLALSATPGSNFKNITEVITNLLISHIECRTDESVDVVPYVFNRKLETVVVPLGGMLQNIKEQYLKILDHYTRPLIKFNVLSGNCAFMTKGKILLTMRDYKENCRNRNNYNQIMCNFTICITLYHGYELLIRHGLRSFLTFFEANIDKPLINSVNNLRAIISEVRDYLGPSPTIDVLPDGTIPDIPEETKFGHPKFYKLADILSLHFQNADNSTRVMVFCEYRESVNEAYMLLLKHRPLIRPKIFIGKGTGTGRGQTQAQQLLAIKMFREGKCNTLIATCIGEEGIDVGEVDLIVCFDISTKSPVRMVQRMGRTGRKRNGRVVILVTEGREQQTLQECLIQKSCMNNLLNSNHISNHFYNKNPRMVPDGLKPSCTKLFITVPKKNDSKNKKTIKNTVKNMFENISSTQSSTKTNSEYDFTDVSIVPEFNKLPDSYEYWLRSKENLFKSEENCKKIYSRRLEKQLYLHDKIMVGHSTTTEAFIELLKFSDKKKYNLPTMQTKNISQRSREEPLTASQVNNFVQVDIRNMFKPRVPKISNIIEIIDEDEIEPPLNDLISSVNNYVRYNLESDMCDICANFFQCTNIFQMERVTKEEKFKKNWVLPDYSVIDDINEELLTAFMNNLKEKNEVFVNNNFKVMNETNDIKEKSKLSETLEFFKLTDIESIFNDDENSNEENSNENLKFPDSQTIKKSNLNMKNIDPPSTPPKFYNNTNLISNTDVSPVLFSSSRIQNFQSKLKRLSQTSQNRSFSSEIELKMKCQKSFNFNEFESFIENFESKKMKNENIEGCQNGIDFKYTECNQVKIKSNSIEIDKKNSENNRTSSTETECYDYDENIHSAFDSTLDDSREIFCDDVDDKSDNMKKCEDVDLNNRTVEDIIVKNMNYNSDEMDVFFDNLEIYERRQELAMEKDNNMTNKENGRKESTEVSQKNNKFNNSKHNKSNSFKKDKSSSSKIDDFFNESIKDLKNIESMFDVGDLSLFDSSGDTNGQVSEIIQNPNEVNFDVGDIFIFDSDNEDNDDKQISGNETENIEQKIISNSPISKVSDFKHIEQKTDKTTEKILSNSSNSSHNETETINKEIICSSPILIKNKNVQNHSSSTTSKKNSSDTTTSNYFDLDVTIIISSDEEGDFVKSPKLSNNKINLIKLNKLKTNQINSSQLNKLFKNVTISSEFNNFIDDRVISPKANIVRNIMNSPQINKSVVNETNSSLLSVTQLISLISDDDSSLDSSLKENKNLEKIEKLNELNTEYPSNDIKNKDKNSSHEDLNISNNKKILLEKSANKIQNKNVKNILGSSYNISRESTPKNINKKFDFFENNLSDFELTLSTPKSKKYNEKSISPVKNMSLIINKNNVTPPLYIDNKKTDSNSKPANTSNLNSNINEQFSKMVWDDLDDFEIPTITQKNKQNIKEKIEERKKNKSPIDWLEDDSLLKFSYTSPWKSNLRNNENDKRPRETSSNHKNKNDANKINQDVNKFNQDVNKSSVYTSQDSPIKVKRNVIRKIVLSDSDDDFEEKQIEVFKKPLITPKKEPSTSKINLKRLNENKMQEQHEKKKLLLKLKKKRKMNNLFIENEAEIENDDDYTSDSDNSEDIDALESSFIADSQMNESSEVDIHAKYLQSVRSPVMKHGGFKIPQRVPRYTNVYSQIEDINEENTYVQDSFCVDSESTLKCNDELSYLERAELEIERELKKKRKRSEKIPKKRKRLLQYFSDSD